MPVPIPSHMSHEEARAFLLSLPDIYHDRIDEALADPTGAILCRLANGRGVTLYADGQGGFDLEQEPIDALLRVEPKKESRMKSLEPMLIIGPRIEPDPNAPRTPGRTLSLTQEILAKRNTIFGPTIRKPFDPANPEDVAALVPPGYRMVESPKVPLRRYIGAQADEVIAKACSSDPEFRAVETVPSVIVKTGAVPVERPRVAGTIDRTTIRAERAASESQAQATHDRVRARQAADPELKASAQRSDGSFYREDGTPHQNLSMTRQPADRDRAPGVGPAPKIPASELPSAVRQLVKGIEHRVCLVAGCNTQIASVTRRFCSAHGYNAGGRLGLKEE